MIFERNRQKDSKGKKEMILISKLFRWRHSHPIRITMLFVIEEMRPWSEPMKINYLFASITNSICLEKIDRKHFQSINKSMYWRVFSLVFSTALLGCSTASYVVQQKRSAKKAITTSFNGKMLLPCQIDFSSVRLKQRSEVVYTVNI